MRLRVLTIRTDTNRTAFLSHAGWWRWRSWWWWRWWWWRWESIFTECFLCPITKKALQIWSTYLTNPIKEVILSPPYRTGNWALRALCTQVELGDWHWMWAWVKPRFKKWVLRGKGYMCVCVVCAHTRMHLIHTLLYFLLDGGKRFKSLRNCGATRR